MNDTASVADVQPGPFLFAAVAAHQEHAYTNIMARTALHLIVTLALLVTGIGAASARGAAPAVDRVVICAGHGLSVLYLDADGEPTQAPHMCPDCVVHLLAPWPDASAGQFVAIGRTVPPWPRTVPQDVRPYPSTIAARGPPNLSI